MQSMNVLNVKKILVFKDTNKPTKLEHNIGIALLLLFTFVDPEIRMSNDRQNLLERGWQKGVVRYFNNCGKVIQNIRHLKEVIDVDQIS